MLSPNARNLVFEMDGIRVTVTGKAHDAVRAKASLAEHSTFVWPIANMVPDSGVQVTVTGAWPPSAVGAV